jgi:hypothetical protein
MKTIFIINIGQDVAFVKAKISFFCLFPKGLTEAIISRAPRSRSGF